MKFDRDFILQSIILLGAAALCFIHLQTVASVNVASRLATIDSLVSRGTFVIDQSPFSVTIDKARRPDGRLISEKPPVFSLIGAFVYEIYFDYMGRGLLNMNDSPNGNAMKFIYLCLGWIPFVLSLYLFSMCVRRFSDQPSTRLLATFAYGFCNIISGYSTSLSNHTFVACLLILAYLAINSLWLTLRRRTAFVFFLLGLCATIDLPSVFFLFVVGFHLFKRGEITRSTAPWAMLGLFVPLALHAWTNWVATGGFLPAYFNWDWIAYPGSYWENPRGWDGIKGSRWEYLWTITLGSRGFFSTTPVFLIALAGIIVRFRDLSPLGRDARWIAVATALLFLFYLIVSPNKFGGECIGFRFMIMVMPFWFLMFAPGVDWLRSWKKGALVGGVLIGLMTAASFYNSYAALVNPWRTGPMDRIYYHLRLMPPSIQKELEAIQF